MRRDVAGDRFDADLRRFLADRAEQLGGAPTREDMVGRVGDGVVAAAARERSQRLVWVVFGMLALGAVGLYGAYQGTRPHVADVSPTPRITPYVARLEDAASAPPCVPSRERVLTQIPKTDGVPAPRQGDAIPRIDVWTSAVGSDPRLVLITASAQQSLVHWPGGTMEPYTARSPDGRRYAFVGARSASECPDPWIVDVAAGTLTNVPSFAVDWETSISWSENSSTIAFLSADRPTIWRDGMARTVEMALADGTGRRTYWSGLNAWFGTPSPDGRGLAFYAGGLLYMARASGPARPVQGLHVSEQGLWWSHDSRWLAIVGGDGASAEGLYLVASTGGRPQRLTAQAYINQLSNVRFSADDMELLIEVHSDDGALITYRVNRTRPGRPVETSRQSPPPPDSEVICYERETITEVSIAVLTRSDPPPAGALRAFARHRETGPSITQTRGASLVVAGPGFEQVLLEWPDGLMTQVAWSPDGRRLALWGRQHPRDCMEAWILDLKTGSGHTIRTARSSVGNVMEQVYEGGGFAWSPDATLLAFRSSGANETVEIVAADGTDSRKLRDGSAVPVWSPDSRTIAFADSEITLMEVATGTVRTFASVSLTRHYPSPFAVSWSPDGASIVFSGCRGSRECGIFRAPSAGGEPELLTAFGAPSGELQADLLWIPEAWIRFRAGDTIYRVRPDGRDLGIDPAQSGFESGQTSALWQGP